MAGIKTTLADTVTRISTTPVSFPLNLAAFKALTYVEIKSVGNLGDYGAAPNIVNYPTLDTDVTSKAKGIEDAGDLSIEVARIFDDPGQIAIRAAAGTKFYYAVQVEYADAPGPDWSNTSMYAAGPVSGPMLMGGGTDDFIRESYTVAFSDQRPIFENPIETP
ncbi:hypothetical protein JZX86_05960 [Agrobacterium rosae]|uniref:hypothetical protein n=1 Tax=Agrobacterium rosae TaxID=1972867 RepID=UPI0019D378A4|nr:hypothetical protein [Agrobacterium rosae]MBN7804909.1 hypothetical protein [Agrobacterium rosae]